MTFPSAACQTCKARRIKCDETKPVCQRCIKSQRVCRMMNTDRAWPIVHIENSYASGQKKRPRGPRPTQEAHLALIGTLGTVLHRPVLDLKTKAVSYFSHHHLQTIKGNLSILRGITTECLPLWETMADVPILDLAISSVALAVYSRTHQHRPAAVEGSVKYQQLLRVQQTAIQSLDKHNVDACLITIFFMSRFEDVVHSPSYLIAGAVTKPQSFSHHDGALAILKYWKVHMSHDYPATDIIKYTRRGMIRSATLRTLGLPPWLWEGSSFGESDDLELGYDSIVVRLANLRYQLSIFPKTNTNSWCGSDESTPRLEKIKNEVHQLDKELEDWAFHNLSAHRRQQHILPDSHLWPTKYFYSATLYSYSSPIYASVWCLYYATRILIYSTLLRNTQHSNPESNENTHGQRSEYLSVMQTLEDDLASSLPFALHMFRVSDGEENSTQKSSVIMNTEDSIKPYVANQVVWPLSMVANTWGVSITQRMWFKSLITQLGKMMGLSVIQHPDQWPEL